MFVQAELEANEVTEPRHKHSYRYPSVPSSMPPRKFPVPQLKPPIGTRIQNKKTHPGLPDAPQSRRSKLEMEEVHAQQAQKKEEEKNTLANNLKTVARIEDELLQEDVQRRTSNHLSQGIVPFQPFSSVVDKEGSDVAPPLTRQDSVERKY